MSLPPVPMNSTNQLQASAPSAAAVEKPPVEPPKPPALTKAEQEDKAAEALGFLKQWRSKVTGMDQILPFLFIGSLRDARDQLQLKKNNIKRIVSLVEFYRDIDGFNKKGNRLVIKISDRPGQNFLDYMQEINEFVHEARLNQESVLIHCLVGISRSVAVTAAYLMSISKVNYYNAIAIINRRHPGSNPNFGFRMQLLKYEGPLAEMERERLRGLYDLNKFAKRFERDCLGTYSLSLF